MAKRALILHAWQNTSDNHWYPWLRKTLEDRGYTVYLPDIPTMNTMSPDLPAQMKYIEKEIPLSSDFIVFGHSLGTLLAMRLAEKHQFSKLFLISGWDYDDLTPEHRSFWPGKLNHNAIQKNVKNIYVISTNNDPYMTEFTMKEMSTRFGATYVFIKDAGHFTTDSGRTEIPELIPLIS